MGALYGTGLRVSRGNNQGSCAFLSVGACVPWAPARAVRQQERAQISKSEYARWALRFRVQFEANVHQKLKKQVLDRSRVPQGQRRDRSLRPDFADVRRA